MLPTKQLSNKQLLKLNKELEKENDELTDEVFELLQCVAILNIKLEKVCKLTSFNDIDSVTVDTIEVLQELQKIDPNISLSST